MVTVKLRRIGNSIGVILPKEVITGYNIGDEIQLNVITEKTRHKPKPVTPCNTPTVTPEDCNTPVTPVEQTEAQASRPPVRAVKTQSYNPMMVGYVPPIGGNQ
jgi:hypothetical protein